MQKTQDRAQEPCFRAAALGIQGGQGWERLAYRAEEDNAGTDPCKILSALTRGLSKCPPKPGILILNIKLGPFVLNGG